MTGTQPLPRLLATLQLASPALPVGGFAYSQGLEKAIEDELVTDAASAQQWIGDLLALSLARVEAPLWLRAFDAARAGDVDAFTQWNYELLASRETGELRAETIQMGASLVRLLPTLGVEPPGCVPIAFAATFAAACAALGIERDAGLAVYLWAWTENQVLVAVKTVPLGQLAGQAMLVALQPSIDAAVTTADTLRDDDIGSAAVGFALTSMRHATMYSRLYRS